MNLLQIVHYAIFDQNSKPRTEPDPGLATEAAAGETEEATGLTGENVFPTNSLEDVVDPAVKAAAEEPSKPTSPNFSFREVADLATASSAEGTSEARKRRDGEDAVDGEAVDDGGEAVEDAADDEVWFLI